MADILHRNVFNFSLFSLPLTSSPPNFSVIRFPPFRPNFSLSSHSSHLHIIQITEHSDDTVSFKFGDASEVPVVSENVDSLNGVELERDDNIGLDDQGVSVIDDESGSTIVEKIIVSDVQSNDVSSVEASVVVVSLKDENVKIENGDNESSINALKVASDGGKLEDGGEELSFEISELSSSLDALEVEVSLKYEDGGGGGGEDSSLHLLNDVGVIEPSLGLENGKVNGASTLNLSQSHDQPCSDVSQASVSGLESSGLDSETVGFDSIGSSIADNSMMPTVASSLDSTKVNDTQTDSISESDGLSDILLAVDPVTSPETSLDDLNEMEILAPELFISSAGASLSHSVEALAGGKDAYFVYENWFGVADGVGQWSLEGVDTGLYSHELMQNCEKLLKSTDTEITNVELLRQSDAMTESTGSARVIIARIASQVLHVANIGDSGFVVIRNGKVFRKSSPMYHEFGFPYALGFGDDSVQDIEEYQVELEDGDVIVTATDGLFDNLYEEEIASLVSKALQDGMHVQDIAQILGTKAQEIGKSESARTPFADAAQAAGHPGYNGGKHDHVTVIVSLVQTR